MTLRRKLFPAPLLSAAALAAWLALTRTLDASALALGLLLALIVPIVTSSLRPAAVRVKRPLLVARFVLRVLGDVVSSNLQVGWQVLAWRWRPSSAKFVIIPLELRDPHGLAALAVVTTVIPGTVWSELALDRSRLLLHVWSVDDPDAFVARYKARYETPLREIFE